MLIFVCEEAVTMPLYKLAIRSIISVLVFFLICGLKRSEKPDGDETKLGLQYIIELSSRITQETIEELEVPEMIFPDLDNFEVLEVPVTTPIFGDRHLTIQETFTESPAKEPTTRREKKRPIQIKVNYIDFIMDSGCTTHVTNDMSGLYDIRLSRADRKMGRIEGCVRGTGVRIHGIGTLQPLGDVLVAPFIAQNL